MTKRGLVLVVGATGSGKSTSLAAMIDHRNRTSAGHIITVEDPVEYVHQSQKSLITHREVGVDTHSLAPRAEEHAAPGARRDPDRRDPRRRDDGARDRLRRDRPPVPGHAARQQRQPDDRPHHQLLPRGAAQPAADGPVGQPARDRLAAPGAHRGRQGPRRPRSRSCSTRRPSPRSIFKGEFHEIKAIMDKSRELGMRTFDWALFELYNEGQISYEEAIRNADSANELRLNIKLKSQRGEPEMADGGFVVDAGDGFGRGGTRRGIAQAGRASARTGRTRTGEAARCQGAATRTHRPASATRRAYPPSDGPTT